jgi:hypothetical protein
MATLPLLPDSDGKPKLIGIARGAGPPLARNLLILYPTVAAPPFAVFEGWEA